MNKFNAGLLCLVLAGCTAPMAEQEPLTANPTNGDIYRWCHNQATIELSKLHRSRGTGYTDALHKEFKKQCLLDHGAQPVIIVR